MIREIEESEYPEPKKSTDEADETPQPSESCLDVPPSGHGAESPPDDDSEWDLPCGVDADPSPTR